MARAFVIDGREMPDPDPNMPVAEVQALFGNFFPEISNATHAVTKKEDGTDVYEFQIVVGTKG